jgi:hypothetical protein
VNIQPHFADKNFALLIELYVKILRIFDDKHEAYSLWDGVTCREIIAGNTN